MENRDRDKLSRNDTSTPAGDVNRQTEQRNHSSKGNSNVEFGEQIGRGEGMEPRSNSSSGRSSGSPGSSDVGSGNRSGSSSSSSDSGWQSGSGRNSGSGSMGSPSGNSSDTGNSRH